MPRPHLVVIADASGEVKRFKLKEWLRLHPEEVPPGFSPNTSTSHQLRGAMQRQGWHVDVQPTEVLISRDGETIAPIAEDEEEEDSANGGDAGDSGFGLESQLRDFMAGRIETFSVAGRRLKLYMDATGRGGVEYPTAVGPIDILAVDGDGNFFVFELKRARVTDRAMGQLARYMGWVRQTIGKDRQVHGVIVAKVVGEAMRYAASVVPNVWMFEYEVEFHLQPVHGTPS